MSLLIEGLSNSNSMPIMRKEDSLDRFVDGLCVDECEQDEKVSIVENEFAKINNELMKSMLELPLLENNYSTADNV